MREHFTALSAYTFLLFNLLCAPCMAAVGAIRREMRSGRWTLFAVTYQTVFAYSVSLIIFQIGSLFAGAPSVPGLVAALAVLAAMVWLLVRKDRGVTIKN